MPFKNFIFYQVMGSNHDASLKSGATIVRKAVVHIDNLHSDCTECLTQLSIQSADS